MNRVLSVTALRGQLLFLRIYKPIILSNQLCHIQQPQQSTLTTPPRPITIFSSLVAPESLHLSHPHRQRPPRSPLADGCHAGPIHYFIARLDADWAGEQQFRPLAVGVRWPVSGHHRLLAWTFLEGTSVDSPSRLSYPTPSCTTNTLQTRRSPAYLHLASFNPPRNP